MRPAIHRRVFAGAADVWRELACRRSGGVLVRLYWRPRGNGIFVHVKDEPTGEVFVLEPPKDAVLTAFYHPYAMRAPTRPSARPVPLEGRT
jgi:hypothetical protein